MLNLTFSLVIIIQTIIAIWAGYIQDRFVDRKAIKLVTIGPCYRTNPPLQFFARVGKIDLRTAFVTNVSIITREDLKDTLKMTLYFKRCASRENLDSCEDYYNLRSLDYCQGISAEDIFPGAINPFSIPFEPKLRCPIKKGVYQALNFSFNFSPFLMFNIDGWYWRIRADINSPKENNRLIGCTNIELYTKL